MPRDRAPRRVAQPPAKPLLIYDGLCGFCRRWIERWKGETGDAVDYAPSQEVAARFPEIPAEVFARSVQLVLPTGVVLEGAEAVFQSLAIAPSGGLALHLYRSVPGFAAASEWAYDRVARHRDAASTLTRLLWGKRIERPEFRKSSEIFLRLLAVCYLAAFVSLWVQIDGLVGSRGVQPVARYLAAVRAQVGTRVDLVPTLSWIDSSDGFLHVQCAAGVAASLLVLGGLAPAASLAVCWALYLSLAVAGQVFLEFQWDSLLLETGFLAIFLASRRVRSWRETSRPSRTALFLLRWLLFRLIFLSGFVKLASGDREWRSLTALRYHYETQPLPPWTAWYLHHAPASFQTFSCAVMFAIELGAPLLIFAPRRLRLFACGAMIFLQLAIAATGNYAFFNLLAIALALLLLDDAALPGKARPMATPAESRRWPRAVVGPIAALLLFASGVEVAATVFRLRSLPSPAVRVVQWLLPFRSVNTYGLFSIMTTTRPEIVLEGSDDRQNWRPYEFRWKPGALSRRPAFVAPHQPRLDWQMWFAALGSAEEQPWFLGLVLRLLEGSPPVLRLLETNPFPDSPPRWIRAVLYDYRFTDAGERRFSGNWWRRRETGTYLPPVTREMLRSGPPE